MTRTLALCAALGALCGCAPRVPPRTDVSMAPDSAETVWGDEYAGLAVDDAETARAMPAGARVEWVDGDSRSAHIDAFARGASVHARSYPAGQVGSVSWRGEGVVREIVAGDFTPAIAEGALIGDPRAGGDLRAPESEHESGLAMRASASTWSAMTGGGVVLAARAYRAALSGWRSHDGRGGPVAAASVERRGNAGVAGVAAASRVDGPRETGAARGAAVSLYAAHAAQASFAAAELAVSGPRMRAAVRVVAGDHREWSAIAVAGAGPATGEPLVFARKERWGAALERRDAWGWGASRAGLSSLSRRDVVSDIRRRRAYWSGEWRMADDTRLELAARITREETERGATGALAARPARELADDWRARATLRAHSVTGNGWQLDNGYRIEWVQNRSGRPGMIAAWTWRLRGGPLETRLEASAHALGRGQVSYSTDAAPPGAVEYLAVTGRGASITASWRLWLRHAWLGAAWSQQPPRAPRAWITLGLSARP